MLWKRQTQTSRGGYFSISDYREDKWKEVEDEEDEDKERGTVCSLMWDIHMKEKE